MTQTVNCKMLTRYKIYRGKRPPEDPLPNGIRKDTRKHTRNCLRPTAEIVRAYQADPTEENWQWFAEAYGRLLEARFRDDRTPFDDLYKLAWESDVFIGCSCPTKANPNLRHCHTVLALEFMQKRYADLEIRFSR